MLHNKELNKMSLDNYLRQLGKAYRKKQGKKMPAEIILIGGASCIINYGFREITTDVDALIMASGSMKDAIKEVAIENGLNYEWLNDDFKKTQSYSPNIRLYSEYYKEFSNCLTVRCVTGEYLLAMKIMSYRYYKNDISDIVGIIREQKEKNNPITFEKVETAFKNLYGEKAIDILYNNDFIINLLKLDDNELDDLYSSVLNLEKHNKDILLEANKNYDLDHDFNINDYLKKNDGFVDFSSMIENKDFDSVLSEAKTLLNKEFKDFEDSLDKDNNDLNDKKQILYKKE